MEGAAGSAGRTESTSESLIHCCGLFLGLSSGPRADEGDAMSHPLPEHPDLGQLRRRAKELRDAARSGDARPWSGSPATTEPHNKTR